MDPSRPTPTQTPTSRPLRIARLVVSVLAAAVLAIGVLAPSAQAAPATTTLVVGTSKATVPAGGSVNVAATLKRSSKVVRSAPVYLQRKINGTKTWKPFKSGKTNSQGRFLVTVKSNQMNYDYRAVYKGTRTAKKATSKTRTVKVAQKASITSTSSTSPTAGQTIKITGKTTTAHKGSTVRLQLLAGKTWQTVGSSKVNKTATYSVSGRATLEGSRTYRAYVVGKTGVTGVVTTNRKFNVYGWHYLSDLTPTSSTRFTDLPSDTSIGGTSYAKSVGNKTGFFYSKVTSADYNLSFKCTRLVATLGLADTSDSTARVGFAAGLDSLPIDLGSMTIGIKKPIDLNTRGIFRLRAENSYQAGPVNGSAQSNRGVWGNARILCLGTP